MVSLVRSALKPSEEKIAMWHSDDQYDVNFVIVQKKENLFELFIGLNSIGTHPTLESAAKSIDKMIEIFRLDRKEWGLFRKK